MSKPDTSIHNVTKLNPEQVKAYEEMSGFKTTGDVTMYILKDDIWADINAALYGLDPEDLKSNSSKPPSQML